ncbi:hypothetical protein FKM82_023370 [Ascaphus truei]
MTMQRVQCAIKYMFIKYFILTKFEESTGIKVLHLLSIADYAFLKFSKLRAYSIFTAVAVRGLFDPKIPNNFSKLFSVG